MSSTNESPSGRTPAGWFADYEREGWLRWWDGEHWTEHWHHQEQVEVPANSPDLVSAEDKPDAPRPTASGFEFAKPEASNRNRLWVVCAFVVIVAFATGAVVVVRRTASDSVASTGLPNSAGASTAPTTTQFADTTPPTETTLTKTPATLYSGLPVIGTEMMLTIAPWDPATLWTVESQNALTDTNVVQRFSLSGRFQGSDLDVAATDKDGSTSGAVIIGADSWKRMNDGPWEHAPTSTATSGVELSFNLGSYSIKIAPGTTVQAKVINSTDRNGTPLAVWLVTDPQLPAGAILQLWVDAQNQLWGFDGKGTLANGSIDETLIVSPADPATSPITAPPPTEPPPVTEPAPVTEPPPVPPTEPAPVAASK